MKNWTPSTVTTPDGRVLPTGTGEILATDGNTYTFDMNTIVRSQLTWASFQYADTNNGSGSAVFFTTQNGLVWFIEVYKID